MVRFLKLLDPWETREGSALGAGEQQRRARELFPGVVAQSRMHYWRPGLDVQARGLRLLLGLAATFSLRDLRLADVLNDALAVGPDVRVDVFNLAGDCDNWDELWRYFPGIDPDMAIVPPLLGVWQDGVLTELLNGHAARARALQLVKSMMSADDVVKGLSPPSRELLGDE